MFQHACDAPHEAYHAAAHCSTFHTIRLGLDQVHVCVGIQWPVSSCPEIHILLESICIYILIYTPWSINQKRQSKYAVALVDIFMYPFMRH